MRPLGRQAHRPHECVLPYKLQPGNVNFELSYGCAAIGEYLAAMGEAFGASGTEREKMQAAFDVFARHEDTLAEMLLSYLRSKKNVRIIGRNRVTDGDRMPTISFVVDGKQSETIIQHVDQFGIGIRFGDFYA
jgi:selenocysteine lyase/cysteine desulfurase